MSEYRVYILRCADNTYYTGIARDVDARLQQHVDGRRGAKYLRGRLPFELVYESNAGDRGNAQRLEHRIKRMTRGQKQALIDGNLALDTRQASGSGSGST